MTTNLSFPNRKNVTPPYMQYTVTITTDLKLSVQIRSLILENDTNQFHDNRQEDVKHF